jgi:hypothetical protein
MFSFAIALNCHPAMVVTNADSQTRRAMAVKYRERRTRVKLPQSPPSPLSPSAWSFSPA